MKKRFCTLLVLVAGLLSLVGCSSEEDITTMNLSPVSNSTYSIGTTELHYLNGWFNNIYVSNGSSLGNITVNGTYTSTTGNFTNINTVSMATLGNITVPDGGCIYIYDSDNSDWFSLCHDGGVGIIENPTGSIYVRGDDNVVADLTGDSAGMYEFQVENSGNHEVFSVDTLGNVDAEGYIANANMSIRTDGTIVPVSMADASALNNSIYFSTNSSKLAYKDSTGVVHDLY